MNSKPVPKHTKQSKRHLRCTFTDVELLAQGKTLAELSRQASQLEEEKKRVTDDYKAKISGVEADISVFANNIRTGYEFRNVDCTETMHSPRAGIKNVRRNDTLEVVGDFEMTQDELQQALPLEEKEV